MENRFIIITFLPLAFSMYISSYESWCNFLITLFCEHLCPFYHDPSIHLNFILPNTILRYPERQFIDLYTILSLNIQFQKGYTIKTLNECVFELESEPQTCFQNFASLHIFWTIYSLAS